MTKTLFRAVNTASVTAMLAAGAHDPRMVENRGQAMPKGALAAVSGGRKDRRQRTKAAALELMGVSRKTLVVAHLHPRWLRSEVSRLMAAGAQIGVLELNAIKAAGPVLAAHNAETGRVYFNG